MSRSGYSDDCESWDLIRWRGAVKSAIRGFRGQAFLQELRKALDELPEHRLIDQSLVAGDGVCALGAVAKRRALDVSEVDPEDRERVASTLGIPMALAAEIMWLNDDEWYGRRETPEARWKRMRDWVEGQLDPDNRGGADHRNADGG
jgi:hypothetical protein